MLITYILLLLSSNAVTLRRDKSILYSRLVIFMLIYLFLILLNLNMTYTAKGLGLYGGLFQTTSITQTFHLFIFAMSALILQLTGFLP